MSQADVSARVRRVISNVFGVAEESVRDDASPETIEKWDSLTHMNLVLALEEEFGLTLSDDDIIGLTDVAAVTRTVAKG